MITPTIVSGRLGSCAIKLCIFVKVMQDLLRFCMDYAIQLLQYGLCVMGLRLVLLRSSRSIWPMPIVISYLLT